MNNYGFRVQFYVFLRAKTVEIHKTVQRYKPRTPVEAHGHTCYHTAWEDQRGQVCQCILYGTAFLCHMRIVVH